MKKTILMLAFTSTMSFASTETTIDLTKDNTITICKNDTVALNFSKNVTSATSGDKNQLTATVSDKSNVVYLQVFQKNSYALLELDSKAYALQVITKDCKNLNDINANPKIYNLIESLATPLVYQGKVIQRAFLDPYDSYGKILKIQLKEDVKDKDGNVILKENDKLEAMVTGINVSGLVQLKLSKNSNVYIDAYGVPYNNAKADDTSRGPAELSKYLDKKEKGFTGFIYFPQDK